MHLCFQRCPIYLLLPPPALYLTGAQKAVHPQALFLLPVLLPYPSLLAFPLRGRFKKNHATIQSAFLASNTFVPSLR